MKKIILIFAVILIFNNFLFSEEIKEIKAKKAIITFVIGDVKVKHKNSDTWIKASLNMELQDEDLVKISKTGKVEILINGIDILRLGSNTTIKINLTVKKDIKSPYSADVMEGKIWVKVRKKEKEGEESFQIQTPVAVAMVRGTVYRVNVEEDTSTQIKVYEGKVEVSPWASEEFGVPLPGEIKEIQGPKEVEKPYKEVSMEQWIEIVQNMEMISISPDRKSTKKKFTEEDDKAEADWVEWNKERDKLK